jgi:hypothetical protein
MICIATAAMKRAVQAGPKARDNCFEEVDPSSTPPHDDPTAANVGAMTMTHRRRTGISGRVDRVQGTTHLRLGVLAR